MIAGLTGLKNVGKDTAADYLVRQYGFVQLAFGDAIYHEVADAFGVSAHDLRSREWKERVQPELALRNCRDTEFVRMIVASEMPQVEFNISPFCAESQTCPRNSTFIIQRWATEYRRARHGLMYWVDKVEAALRVLPRGTRVVISDVREHHELSIFGKYLAMHGTMKTGIAEIRREGAVHSGHQSDNGLRPCLINTTITNRLGDLAGLYNQLDDFILRGMQWTIPIK